MEKELFLQTKFRSKRTKKRLIKEDFDKFLLSCDRQFHKLRKIKQNTCFEQLEKPIQRGYVRTFQLTIEAQQMPDAEVYLHVLSLINTQQYSNYPIFNDKLGKRKARRLKTSDATPKLKDIPCSQYAELNDKEKMLFEPIYRVDFRGLLKICAYRFKYSWLFKLETQPYMVNQIERLYCDVERQYAFYNKVRDMHWNRLVRLWNKHGYRSRSLKVKYKVDLLRNIPKCRMLEFLELEVL